MIHIHAILSDSRLAKRAQGITDSFRSSNYGFLSVDPTVILTSYRAERSFPFFQIQRIIKSFPHRNIHFLLYICSHFPKGHLNRLHKHYKTMGRAFSDKIHFLTNTAKQLEEIKSIGFSGVFCNHNALIDEHTFNIHSVNKKWDALYDAQMDPVKRHHLAALIPHLAIIFPPVGRKNKEYYQTTLYALRNASMPNFSMEKQYSNLSPERVSKLINLSHTGLCLSSKEGAMYASIQYLLCGVPVVSTNSIGGRDEFFDCYNSIIVDDSPEAVYDGVALLKDRNCCPYLVRESALKRVWQHRERLFQYLGTIIPDTSPLRIEKSWEQLFFNKLTYPMISFAQLKKAIQNGSNVFESNKLLLNCSPHT